MAKRYEYLVAITGRGSGGPFTGRGIYTLKNPISSEKSLLEIEESAKKDKGYSSFVITGFNLLREYDVEDEG